MPSAWTSLRGAVDPIVRPYNLYTAYELSEAEYIGSATGQLPGPRGFLQRNGYEPQYLSAAKRHPETGQLHELSYRRIPDAHPPPVIPTPLLEWEPSDCQYHVHVFERNPLVFDFFSHYELKPDLLPFDLERLETHYGPRYGKDYLRGVTDLTIPDAL